MKHFLSAAAVAALVVAGAGAAQAQDASWSGPYLSSYAAFSKRAKNDNERVLFDTNLDGVYGDTVRTGAGADAFSPGFCDGSTFAATPAPGCFKDDTGFEFGARAGYDMQFGSIVVGALIEGSRLDVDDHVTAFSTTPASYTLKRTLEYQMAVRGRAGFATGKTLIYGTGGAARGRIEHNYFSTNSVNSFPRGGKTWQSGWQAGGGIEHRFFPNVVFGAEYIYTRYDDSDGMTLRATGPAPATNPFILVNSGGTNFRRSQDDLKVHSFRLTTSYRF
ncbi:outer membrane protein [Phenylobacterium immobile]|uniref:outer membrane protein n=1 Tax=Phenylobacterium immobile TaxID=21 RepID=UPI000A528167|nr:outer membrane beta-barrel protein [Phenylobacterium immobile]